MTPKGRQNVLREVKTAPGVLTMSIVNLQLNPLENYEARLKITGNNKTGSIRTITYGTLTVDQFLKGNTIQNLISGAFATVIHNKNTINYGTLTLGPFAVGDVITGQSSGAQGYCFFDNGSNQMVIIDPVGVFLPTEIIDNANSGGTTTAIVSNANSGTLVLGSVTGPYLNTDTISDVATGAQCFATADSIPDSYFESLSLVMDIAIGNGACFVGNIIGNLSTLDGFAATPGPLLVFQSSPTGRGGQTGNTTTIANISSFPSGTLAGVSTIFSATNYYQEFLTMTLSNLGMDIDILIDSSGATSGQRQILITTGGNIGIQAVASLEEITQQF